jgi:pullulanase/glycogen debranching enzyme
MALTREREPSTLGGRAAWNDDGCQDNETSWVDWSLRQRSDQIAGFSRNVLALRRAHPVLRRDALYSAVLVGRHR